MNKAHIEFIKGNYASVVTEYAKLFAQKHDYFYEDTDWVGGDVGGVVAMGEMFINFDDIRYDIDNDVDKDMFVQYYDYTLECVALGLQTMNYRAFTHGCPRYTAEQFESVKKAQARVEEAKQDLLRTISEVNQL